MRNANKKLATRFLVLFMVAVAGAGAIAEGPTAAGTVSAERSLCC
jgi:hypothetical protein